MGFIINEDKNFQIFNKRMFKALCREKFNRKQNIHTNTPSSIANSNRFYTDIDNKKVFVCYPILHFDKILQLILFIAYTKTAAGEKEYHANDLLKFAFCDPGYQSVIKDYNWSKDFENFKNHLIEESFFYFDDLSNQYYFNLFRLINNGEFTGGFLHALSKHYKGFNKFHPYSNEEKDFEIYSLIVDVVMCCIKGEIIDKKPAKTEKDYKLIKRMNFENHALKVVLYWDSFKELFILTSFYPN